MEKQTEFADVYVHNEQGRIIFCYRTGLTVYEEEFARGRLTTSGFQSAGYTLNVLEDMPKRLSAGTAERLDAGVFAFEADGTSCSFDLEYIGFDKQVLKRESNGSEYLLARAMFRSASLPLRIDVCTELDGGAVLIRYLEIENTASRDVKLSNITPMRGVLEELEGWNEHMKTPDPSGIYSVGYAGSSRWGCEGLFEWHPLHNGIFGIPGKYNSDRFRHPGFFLKNNLTGGMFAAQLAYSGGYEFSFNLMAEPEQGGFSSGCVQVARLGYEIKLTSPAPQYILAPGKRFCSPKVHLTRMFDSFDGVVNEMHRHIRRSVLPAWNEAKSGLLSAGMGTERVMTVEATKHFADTAAMVGAKALIIDAGWYCPPGKGTEWHARTGDWVYDRELYPNGIQEIISYIHAKGLLFGIWLDPERLGVASRAAVAHPEWLSNNYFSGGKGSIIDMTIPEAASWVEEEIARVLTETGAELFRLDYNIGVREVFGRSVEQSGAFCNTLAYCESVNAMYKRLRKRFPHVIFENCAAGGGRTDLGMMENFEHTWVSDWQIAPRSFAITNGMTIFLPPECVDRLVSGMYCHTKASLDFQVRQTLFGKPTTNSYNACGSAYNPLQLEHIRHAFEIYQRFIRPYAAQSRVYHHTPEINGIRPLGTGILERGSAERDRSVIGVFRLAEESGREPVTVYPRGIDPCGDYRVSFDNASDCGRREVAAVVSGYELVQKGLRVDLEEALSSELILLERV